MQKNNGLLSMLPEIRGHSRGISWLLLGLVLMNMNDANAVTTRSLPPCPSSPNCVSSQATDEKHAIAALAYSGEVAQAWQALIRTLESFPRSKIVAQSEGYLHVEFTSRVFRFVDDVEFIPDPGKKLIHVRSASRTGYGDFGVNRRRVESIRGRFQQQLKATQGR